MGGRGQGGGWGLEMVTPDLGYSSSSFIPRPYKYNCGYFGNSADTKGQTCGRLRIQSIKERWKRPRRWEARLEMVTPDLNYSSPPPSSPSLCPESDCSNYLQLLQKIDFQRLGRFCPNMPLGVVYTREKENLLAHQKWACASNFCEPNFQEFRLKWWRKELL